MAKKQLGDSGFDFFDNLKTGDPYADAGKEHPDFGYFDSGSYALNALMSGDLFGGFPMNNFVMFVGRKGSGKSYIGKNNFCYPLMENYGYRVIYIDTEGDTTDKKLQEDNGFKPGKYKLIKNVHSVEDLIFTMEKIIGQIEANQGKALEIKEKIAFVLDSQGMLTTNKALNDAANGEDKQDMTKAKKLTGFYRNVVGRCASLGIPCYITNHVYLDPGAGQYANPEKIAGGESGQYAGASIINMFKTYEKLDDNKTIKGVVFKCTVLKSRTVRDKISAPIYLDYEKGLDPYYGLQQLAESAGLIEEYTATKFPDLECPKDGNGQKTRKKCVVIKDPKVDPSQWAVCKAGVAGTKRYMEPILNEINEYVKKMFKYKKPSLRDADDDGVDIDADEAAESEAKYNAAMAEELEQKRQMLADMD